MFLMLLMLFMFLVVVVVVAAAVVVVVLVVVVVVLVVVVVVVLVVVVVVVVVFSTSSIKPNVLSSNSRHVAVFGFVEGKSLVRRSVGWLCGNPRKHAPAPQGAEVAGNMLLFLLSVMILKCRS